jgi:phenylpropionate dioxygenase-like ring-hydroxylating dioxygenase large terminal subunit
MRQNDASVQVFANQCPHRGGRLILKPEGNIDEIVCPHCKATWLLDGVPVDPSGISLTQFRHDSIAGFVFMTMNETGPTLQEYLGPVWDDWQRYKSEDWVRTSAATVAVDCNWKVPQDNSCESYHLPTVHPQGEYWIEHDYTQCVFDWCDEGHNRMAIQMGTPAQSLKNKDLRIDDQLASMLTPWGLDPNDFTGCEYDTRLALQKAKREHAESKGYQIGELEDDQLTDAYHYNIFPNVTVSFAGCEYVSMQRMRPHPQNPGKCFYDNFTFGAKGSESDADLDGLGGKEWLHEGKERQFFTYGERLMNRRIADQDLSIVVGQQLGLGSRGFTGVTLAKQEHRVQRFHEVIDQYLESTS